ncbi:MAG TPA: carboxypeptidase regulatory-like domain-containing protein [Pyrinomonadaceae bacterium]
MLKKRASFWLANILILSLLALSFACGKKETAEVGSEEPAGATPWKATGEEGTITGKVSLDGTAPALEPINTSADNNCAAKNPTLMPETLVVKDQKIQYVFVYIKEGTLADGKKITDFKFETPATEVVLDQNGCHYAPHVLGMQPNQKLTIKNSDQTTHNINAMPDSSKGNTPFNESQGPGAAPLSKTFARSEILVPVKCNQHPWMKAYIGVVRHPFFAVSKEDGTFKIENVPAGDYTVVAWQEKGGGGKGTQKTMQVKVPAKGNATADFTFNASELASTISNGTSLEMMPALEIPMLGRH